MTLDPSQAIDDTEPWARNLLVQHWRRQSPQMKLQAMSDASIALEQLSIDGLRRRYPLDSEEDLRLRAAALRIGKDEFTRWTGRTFEW